VDPERLHESVVNCWFLSLGAKTYRILVALVIAGSEGVPTTSGADPALPGQSSVAMVHSGCDPSGFKRICKEHGDPEFRTFGFAERC